MFRKVQAISEIKNLNKNSLVNSLNDSGYGDLKDVVILKNLNGDDLINLTEFQIKSWRLGQRINKRLQECIDTIKLNPESFIIKQQQTITIKQEPKITPNQQQKITIKQEQKITPNQEQKISIKQQQKITPKQNFKSNQNNATRAKLEQFFTMPPSSQKPTLSPKNFTTICSSQDGDGEYLCMKKPENDSMCPVYDEHGYLNPAALRDEDDDSHDYEPSPNINQFERSRKGYIHHEPGEEEYENFPLKPKPPKRPQLPTPISEGRGFSKNDENKFNRNLQQEDAPPPPPALPKRTNLSESTVLTKRIPTAVEESPPAPERAPKPEMKNKSIFSWVKDKQLLKTTQINDKLKEQDSYLHRNKTIKVNEEEEEENIYEQEPLSSSPQNRKPEVSGSISKKPSFSNRPLPEVPVATEEPSIIRNDQKFVLPPFPSNFRNSLSPRPSNTFKSSKESIISEHDEDNLYKNDSAAFELVKKELEQQRQQKGLNESFNLNTRNRKVSSNIVPSSLRITSSSESLSSNRSRNMSSNISYSSDAETDSTRHYETDKNKSGGSRSLANIPFKPLESIPIDTLRRKKLAERRRANDSSDDDRDSEEIPFNLNDEPYYRNTDIRGAKQLLHGLENGAFLFRPSKSCFLTLTIKWDRKYFNIHIQNDGDLIYCDATEGSSSPSFPSFRTFIQHFQRNPLGLKRDNKICEVYLKCVLPSNRF